MRKLWNLKIKGNNPISLYPRVDGKKIMLGMFDLLDGDDPVLVKF